MNKKISVIGCGNIGLSLIQGFLRESEMPAGIHPQLERRNLSELVILNDTGVRLTSDNIRAVKESEIVIIAVKPYNLSEVLAEIKDHLDPSKHVVVSITAGATINQLREGIGKGVPLFRAMPNISASVGKSVTCICHSEASKRKHKGCKEPLSTSPEQQ